MRHEVIEHAKERMQRLLTLYKNNGGLNRLRSYQRQKAHVEFLLSISLPQQSAPSREISVDRAGE